ncbi:PREDICTED: aspartic proteinase CDR1-like [Erythranthe guttata]|uniref:aspartic proteinase CDR1-like n=1 Tax=Erythranthe guttata TaxID=4155 RepID=UPI00064DAB42|nr:PREDICTED: aspartic proteinase CDR1-like [Erythranthe guttata]|eukprot:XP_012837359.1 PREDICTED: aspartic proteinase CDR1-like [Erythranthe guttata]
MNSFRRSITRSIHLGLSTNTEQVSAAEAPITPDSSGEFLMKILIGTPAVELAAVVDTGSDLTWAQCAPCQNCYDQKPPLYDSTKSKTFQNVSCESDQCKLIGQGFLECDKTNLCRYYVSYGDGSTFLGNIAVETFTIGEASGTFPEVVFGCGNFNYGTFEESMSGIVGLGGGSSSILRQLGTSIGSKFSYCLTSFDSNVSSKISFGSNAVVKGDKVMSTPLKKGASDTFYTVTLKGISVGNTKPVNLETS